MIKKVLKYWITTAYKLLKTIQEKRIPRIPY